MMRRMGPDRRSIDDLVEESRARLQRLEPRAAYSAMQAGTVLIDTRSDDQLIRRGRIPGALHIPLSVLEWRVDPASDSRDPAIRGPDQQLILVCAQGYSSSLAAARLQELGFHRATDVIGGFEAWEASGLPVER
jgi:rhodanese-related sulfurtransferase